MIRYEYSQWDGSQEVPDLDPDELLDILSDDLLSKGNITRALQRLMQSGFNRPFGDKLRGIQDLLQQLRKKRQQTLERYNLNSIMDDLRQRLDSALKTEREGMERRLEEAQKRYQEMKKHGLEEEGRELLQPLERVVSKNQSFLDNLPPDLGGQVQALSNYEFMDSDARQQFQELMDMLKKNVMESHFQDISQQLKGMTPEDMKQLNEMVKNLNEMLRQKMEGGTPNFQQFMEQFGHYFGPNPPSSLEELMDQLRQRMAQAQSLLESLSPEARQSLEDLMKSLLQGQGLKDELAELMSHLQDSMSDLRTQYPFQGDEPLSLTEALKLMEHLQQMAELEKQLAATQRGAPLEDINAERLRRLLDEEAYQNLEQLKKMTELLENAGYISRNGQRLELTAKGMRKIGQKALREVFAYIKKDRFGKHQADFKGMGGESHEETKKYEFGDPFLVHLEQTLMNALQRDGPGVPLKLEPEDFEIYRSQQLSQCSTVLMLDLSWSMPIRGNFFAAKKVVVALEALIRSQFPRDNLYLVGFSEMAQEITTDMLPNLNWNEFVYGTNMHHGFILSRRLLSKHKSGNRQIIMISDGEPTAHMEGGQPYFEYPPSPRTLELTLLEAKRCAQAGITINTFMLGQGYDIEQFMELLAKVSRGRVFFTSADQLGKYVLVDYVTNRRKRINS